MQIQELEMKKKQLQQEQENWEAEMAFKEKQLAEEKRQFDEQMAQKKSSSSRGSSGSGSGGGNATVTKQQTPINKQTTADRIAANNPVTTDPARQYLDALIASGANRNDVILALNQATNAGAITKEERTKLGNIYLPKGHQYT